VPVGGRIVTCGWFEGALPKITLANNFQRDQRLVLAPRVIIDAER